MGFTRLTALLIFIVGTAIGAESAALKAELVERGEGGRIVSPELSKQLVRTPTPEAPAGFIFEFGEHLGVSCTETGCASSYRAMRFDARTATRDTCGSVRYVSDCLGGAHARLVVVDHSERTCDDYRPYKWEVTLEEAGAETRYFGGNPKPVESRRR